MRYLVPAAAKTVSRWVIVVSLLCLLMTSRAPVGNAQSGARLSGTLTVFAAASLTEPFSAMIAPFNTLYPNLRIRFNFAGSQSLRTQLEQGALADVFASADVEQMTRAQQSQVVSSESFLFARNRLVVIIPRENPGQLTTFRDLATPGLRVVLAGSQVPAGRYSRRALRQASLEDGADFEAQVLNNLVSEEHNVKQVVTKVQLAEADAGITYVSDVTPRIQADIQTLQIAEAYNQIATYPIAVVAGTRQRAAAEAFIQFIRSDAGQAILATYKFAPVKEH